MTSGNKDNLPGSNDLIKGLWHAALSRELNLGREYLLSGI